MTGQENYRDRADTYLEHIWSSEGQSIIWEYCRLTFGYGQGYELVLIAHDEDGERYIYGVEVPDMPVSAALTYRIAELGQAGWDLCATTLTGREADIDLTPSRVGQIGKTTCFYFKRPKARVSIVEDDD